MANVTISEVAAAAGVSMKTVSRVVNREPGVRQATRERVLDAIEELQYHPNQSARSLAGNRAYLIGLLFDVGMGEDSYMMRVQTGVLRRCRQEGYELMIHPCDCQAKGLEKELRDIVRHARVDGLILVPPLSDMPQVGAILGDANLPYVAISPGLPDERYPCVRTDEHRAAFNLTRHLIELGHTRICFIAGHPDHLAMQQRLSGFQEAMRSAGIRPARDAVAQGYNTFESGLECSRELVQRKRPPSAIFAANDNLAAGAMAAAYERGLTIPGDISIAGFDDSPVSRQLWPALTTVSQPVSALSEAAAGLLLDRLYGRDNAIHELSMKAELVLRDSTGPARD